MSGLWLPSSTHTEALGAAFARSCPWHEHAPCVLFLQGDLGAGKTTLARGLLQALGITGAVRSPSYTLIETYALGGNQIAHVDLYRLRSAAELEELGLRDYFSGHSLVLIEWPQRAREALPTPDVEVVLEVSEGGRRAHLSAQSASGVSWLSQISIEL